MRRIFRIGAVIICLEARRSWFTARMWWSVEEETVVFAGRERGEFIRGGLTVPLAIRTTRVFRYFGGELGWRQVHHHGAIDDPAALA